MSVTPQILSRAPWRDILDDHLRKAHGYEFTLATVSQNDQGQPTPRVRVCGFRGFFPTLNLHPNGKADMEEQVTTVDNLASFESDMLTFTTDCRMEKLKQLQSSHQEVEAIFWLKEVSSQWRIKGKAYAVGNPCGEEDIAERTSRSEIYNNLRFIDREASGELTWSWDHAVSKYFANHSPIMRASFKHPAPGQPRDQQLPDNSFGTSVTDIYDHEARKNFRVVAIIPEDVEMLDLSNNKNLRRWRWTLDKNSENLHVNHQWSIMELWP